MTDWTIHRKRFFKAGTGFPFLPVTGSCLELERRHWRRVRVMVGRERLSPEVPTLSPSSTATRGR